jgi:hypothetical protein
MDRIQQQKTKMNRDLSHIQNYEDRYEQSANLAVQFLVFTKTSHAPQIKDNPSQLLSVITGIRMSKGKRQVGIDGCVKLMSTPIQHASVSVREVSGVRHISRVTSDRVWACDYNNNLFLTDTTGVTIQRVPGMAPWYTGVHTINSCGELIYIDRKFNINKLSTRNRTVTTLLNKPSPWEPHCVYFSPTTKQLMVGMFHTSTRTGKVTLYSDRLQLILTIQHNKNGHTLYRTPRYITENRNSDIIVSD